MSFAFKFGFKEHADKLKCKSLSHNPLTEAKNVSVIVESSASGTEIIRAYSCSYAVYLVC